MRRREVTALLRECAAEEIPFSYGEDKFAQLLLGYARSRYPTVRALRASPWGRLLERPRIKKHFVGRAPDVALERALAESWDDPELRYKLTFGRWGHSEPTDWPNGDQTSRPGENVVLQVNFTSGHNRAYQRLLRPQGRPFVYRWHPVHPRHNTLSWARIDLELAAGEATIEEIQTDWVRLALEYAERARQESEAQFGSLDEEVASSDVLAYVESVLEPHRRKWAELTFTAAIQWLHERFGIRRIFANTFETGNRLKDLSEDSAPPRSLYTDLPRRFGFVETRCAPRALACSRVPAVRERIRDPARTRAERPTACSSWITWGETPRAPRWFLLEL